MTKTPWQRRARLGSIRFTLAVWYLSVLTAILSSLGWLLYTSIQTGLNRDINQALSLEGAGIAGSIVSYWKAQREAPGSGPGNWVGAPAGTFEELVSTGRLADLVASWAESASRLTMGHPIRILSQNGRILAETAGVTQLALPVNEAAMKRVGSGEEVYDTLAFPAGRIRLVTHPIVEGERVLYLVQVAASLNPVDASRARLRMWLLWLIPSTVVLTGLVGWWLINRALRPIGRMIRQARQIGATRLDERLEVPASGDELEDLGRTFNDLLARLERAFRRLRQFSAAASHELRTPLTVMKGELEVALRKPRTEEVYRDVLRTHLSTIDEMAETVEQLLALARSEAAEDAIERELVELGALVWHVWTSLQLVADAKTVRVEITSPAPVWVQGERRLLERLLANLLENAIRHTPSGGRIDIRVESQDDEAVLMVTDTGPGISPEVLPRLFDRFFARRASEGEGTGLGLGLCRWIAEVHQGRLDVESPPGKGATFLVRLPLRAPR